MRIGIDIDDTIVNTRDVAMEYINKYKKDLNIKNYEEFKNLKVIEFYQEYTADIQKEVKLLPGVLNALNILKEKGYELIFITARGSNVEFTLDYDYETITEEMFKKFNIPHDKIVYKSYPKGRSAKEEKIDLFIDDLESNLDDLVNHGIKCIKIVKDKNLPSNHLQFDNWNEILKYILEMGELNE